MTPQRWADINQAFATVLDRAPDDRSAYLDAAFADDFALRDAVARLLRAARQAENEGFLKDPAWVVVDVPLVIPDFKHGDSEFSAIEYIGQGGMGVVYKAYDKNFERWVALKFSSSSRLLGVAGVERFRAEAQNMARLKHPNIVTVHETGEHHGRPYFVMDLIEGTPLTERVNEFVERPRDAAALMETVALAVHHAHQRRILHNDLKPGNILLDAEDQPHVGDFGLARRLGEGAASSATGVIEGTAGYMSPEQTEGREITTASDVYGLGAVLYTLLTGRAPFRGETVQETLRLVRTEAPAAPRALNAKVDADLEAICLRCLQKDKAERYVSASSLAHDLERYRSGIETIARPWAQRERIVAWCRRNKVEAGLVTAVVAVWVFAMVMALSVAQAQKAHLLHATVEGVSFAAKDLAQAALLQLRYLGRNIELVTADRRLASLLANDDRESLHGVVESLCREQRIPIKFVTCYVINRDGIMVAHAPSSDRVMGQDFSWRNHFQGARAKAAAPGESSVHVSHVYRGRSDDVYKFAVAAPILDSQNNFLGTIATSVATDSTMGIVIHDDRRKVALIAPADINNPDERRSNQHVVFNHPAYRRGIDPVAFPAIDRIRAGLGQSGEPQPQQSPGKPAVYHDDHYIDPAAAVAPDYAGRWIAGFAPVGNTGFFVVVQQRFEEAVDLESSTLWSLALWSAAASLVAVAILLMALWQWARNRMRAGAGLRQGDAP